MYYHGKSLCKGRSCEPNRPYLITTVTHEREPIFASFAIARLLIDEMRATSGQLAIKSPAWVVMPDHLHWLFVLENSTISDVVTRVKGRSAYAINEHRCTDQPIWQPGFHDHAVRKDEDIKQIARYIVANPLRAGLASRIADYPHWDAVWL